MKPIPATAPPPATAAQPTGGRSRPPVSRVAATCAQDADRLPDDVAEQDPERDRRRERVTQGARVDGHARVRQGEERHDRVARPWVESSLQPLVRGDRRTRARPAPSARARGSAARGTRRKSSVARSRSIARRRVRVGEQAHGEPDDDGLHARFEHGHPADGAEERGRRRHAARRAARRARRRRQAATRRAATAGASSSV